MNCGGRRLWVLDAYPGEEGLVVELYDEVRREITELKVRAGFYGYLVGRDPQSIARELEAEGLVEEAFVEKWLAPPYYRAPAEVVVFRVGSLHALMGIYRASAARGVKPVNEYPNPVVEALYRSGLRPLVPASAEGELKSLSWDPAEEDPAIDWVAVGVERGYYLAEGPGRAERFEGLKDLAGFLLDARPLLAFTEPGIYLRLLEEEPGLRERVRKWVLGGPRSAHEYFEWSRLAYTPLSLMGNVTIGKLLTTIEALEARRLKYLVSRGVGRHEGFRRADDLLLNDRGGVVAKPRPGVYWHVCQVDFKSLYPSIIAKLNISGETVDDPECGRAVPLEHAGKSVCVDRRGIASLVAERLISLKELYEALRERGPLYERRRAAVKWLLVASFGYLGYRNSLFGSPKAHEAVTATARLIMRKAAEAVAGLGLRVVHAIVDSLFVSGVERGECPEVARAIEAATGYATKVEAYYVWLYVPPELDSRRGASNKYYGLTADGSIRAKGILAVRKDTPAVVREAELEALEILSRAKSPEEFPEACKAARETVIKRARALEQGDVRWRDLVIVRGGRGLDYARPPAYAVGGRGPPYMLLATSKGLLPPERGRPDVGRYARMLQAVLEELPAPSQAGRGER